MITNYKFDLFKEITIGGISKEQLLLELTKAGIQFNHYATLLFDHPQFSPPPKMEKVKLVKVTFSEMELKDTCTFNEFSDRATLLGLQLCPLYLAAFLRLNYLDQADGPYLTIASKKPEADENFPNGFYLRNVENTLWLRGYKADGLDGWPGTNEFIFQTMF
jgi:hypothetical protein